MGGGASKKGKGEVAVASTANAAPEPAPAAASASGSPPAQAVQKPPKPPRPGASPVAATATTSHLEVQPQTGASAQKPPRPPRPGASAAAAGRGPTTVQDPRSLVGEDESSDDVEEAESRAVAQRSSERLQAAEASPKEQASGSSPKGAPEGPSSPSSPQKAAEASPKANSLSRSPSSCAKVGRQSPTGKPKAFAPGDLAAACRAGDAATTQAFLVAKARTARGLADCEEALFDAFGDSVLHHAVQGGSAQVVDLLLTLGRLQVDIPNARNESALQVACRRGKAAMVSQLLEAEADPNRRDASGLTPFLTSIFAGADDDVLGRLVKAGADISAQDSRGVGALHFGALRGDIPLLEWLLRNGADVDIQTEHATTPLMLAAKRGNIDSVSLLLGGKASTSPADEAGCTALMQALSAGNVEVALKILSHGASVDTVDCAGRSALFHAVLGGRVEGLGAVIERGGRVNMLDEEGRSPLYQACLMGEPDLVNRLLEANADPNLAGRGSIVRASAPQRGEGAEEEGQGAEAARACLDEARTCLQVCATLAHNGLLTRILQAGADVNSAPGTLGWTSLHLCAAVCNEEGVALLLAQGARTNLPDAEGNTSAALAERAGHASVLHALQEAEAAAAAAAPEGDGSAANGVTSSPAARRGAPARGQLPPIAANAEPDPPEAEAEPLAVYREDWQPRPLDGSLLDRVFGPMVHDALTSDQWRIRWEALSWLAPHFSEVAGSPADVVTAVAEVLASAALDKVSKVFLAALAVLDELLSDARVDILGADEFTALLRGVTLQDQDDADAEAASAAVGGPDGLLVLLDQTDAAGGSSIASSPQQAASDAICSCILHGRVPLDEAAWPLLLRIDERLRAEASPGQGGAKDRKEAALGPKCLAANLKLLGRWLTTFGLQQSGLFRRALVLPLLLRAAASEHSKARAAAREALVQLMALSGGVEERLWALLPSKARRAVQKDATGQEGLTLQSAVPCAEDAMAKSVIVSEDSRAGAFVAVSELNPQVFAALMSGEPTAKSPVAKTVGRMMPPTPAGRNPGADLQTPCFGKMQAEGVSGSTSSMYGVPDDEATIVLQAALGSKNWKERVDGIAGFASELAAAGDTVKLVEAPEGSEGGGPLLSQYVLRSHRISALQASLGNLLAETVTAVFLAAADLLRLVCSRVPLYIAPLFLEPLLLPLVARLLDTSGKVRGKALETTLEVAALHSCALSEMIAQCVARGSAWSSAPPPTAGGNADRAGRASDSDRSTGPRLQLLAQLVRQVQSQNCAGRWTDETWKALSDYALRAAEHKSADVRKESSLLLSEIATVGGSAAEVAEYALSQLQVLAQQRSVKRPGTSSTRPTTGSTRMGSRPGTGANVLNASGRMSSMGSTGGFTLSMGSTGRLSTAGRSKTGTGTSFRPRTGGGWPSACREREPDEESDNSVHSDAPPLEGSPTAYDEGAEGVQFFNVQTACPGGDEVPDLAEGEQALREALPLAEALDEVALDFVAPLIALFGDGWTRCFYSRNWQCRVAALTHLSATMGRRLEEYSGAEVAPAALGELLDGAMRAVHEGLGDQNVRVYTEACLGVTAVVPAFCGVVDGRLLVAHLAPLLRQLCARMGDSKESVRTETTQALFRLLRPPTGNIVSPAAIAMLVLRHLAPPKDELGQGGESPASLARSGSSLAKGTALGWLCRIAALRDLAKEYPKSLVQQPGSPHPGEWLRLKDGMSHSDPAVRHEAARLYTLICKMHLKSLGDEETQGPSREAWVAALPKDTPAKTMAQVRKLLKLHELSPEKQQEAASASTLPGQRAANAHGSFANAWEVPDDFAVWVGCPTEALKPFRSPVKGDEQDVLQALKVLSQAVTAHEGATARRGPPADEAFASICKAVQQSLAGAVGADRAVFLASVKLCQQAVSQLAAQLSGLDINLGLAKLFPTLMERTSQSAMADVKIGVASDKLVQTLAKHPKVGCEAVTKMVISTIARTEHPIRPLVLLRTLLSDFGLRLCGQRDIIALLLRAMGVQLERVDGRPSGSTNEEKHADDILRSQLVGVLATCNQFSSETVRYCMGEVEPSQRPLVTAALQEAPDPRLVALGATAAEQTMAEDGNHCAGSAVRALSRSRGASPKARSPRLATLGATGADQKMAEDGNHCAGSPARPLGRSRSTSSKAPYPRLVALGATGAEQKMAEAPYPRLVALGATAAEQKMAEDGRSCAGSTVRALNRSRSTTSKAVPPRLP